MATTQTLTVYRGEQVALNFTMDPVENITSWGLKFTVAQAANSTNKKISVTPTITDGPNGAFRVALTEEQLDLNPATYFFDVWRVDEGFEHVLAIGPFVVSPTARVPPL